MCHSDMTVNIPGFFLGMTGNEVIGFFLIFFICFFFFVFFFFVFLCFLFVSIKLSPYLLLGQSFFLCEFCNLSSTKTFLLYPERFAWNTMNKHFRSVTATPQEVQPRS